MLQAEYPAQLLHSVKIVPASWFFHMCNRVTSRVMDRGTRAKFRVIAAGEVQQELHALFDRDQLPQHLGGSDTLYKSVVHVQHNPADETSLYALVPRNNSGRGAAGNNSADGIVAPRQAEDRIKSQTVSMSSATTVSGEQI